MKPEPNFVRSRKRKKNKRIRLPWQEDKSARDPPPILQVPNLILTILPTVAR